MRILTCAILAITLAACGGDKKNAMEPDGVTSSGCFAVVGNRGSIKATVSGLPAFSGIVATGGALYAPAAGPAPATFTVGATDVNQGATVILTGPVMLGATTATLTSVPGNSVSIQLLTRSCTAGTGGWSASPTLGTASITLTTATAASVAGTFTGTLMPTASSGAVGDKTITGSFSGTF